MVLPSTVPSSTGENAPIPSSETFPPVDLAQIMQNFSVLQEKGAETPKTIRTRTPKEPRSRNKKIYCKVCQSSIVKEGGRSQGARRHILQHHIKKSLYRCKVCEYSSNYDKGHVKAHIRRIHQGTGEVETLKSDEEEEKLWLELCFGKEEFHPGSGLIHGSPASSSEENEPQEAASSVPVAVEEPKVEEETSPVLPQIDPQMMAAALQQLLQNAALNLYEDLMKNAVNNQL